MADPPLTVLASCLPVEGLAMMTEPFAREAGARDPEPLAAWHERTG